ncbi:MAG: hypothetical protein OER88_10240 [Planctomycetota bacterium]|nr:hypothetical protein [Planctomycetota bacterium]
MKLLLVAFVAILCFAITAPAQQIGGLQRVSNPGQERFFTFRKGKGTWMDRAGKSAQANGTRPMAGALLSPNALTWAGVTDGQLWIANAQGKNKSDLAKGYKVVGTPSWTPDGLGLAFAAGNDIHVVDVNTKDVRRLTKSLEPLTRPALDSSGSWLVYVLGDDVMLKHLVAHEERVLVRDAKNSVYAWNAAGDQLAWVDRDGLHFWNVYSQEHVKRTSPVPLAELREITWTPSGGAVAMRRARTIHLVDRKAEATIALPKDAEPGPLRWQLLPLFDG